MQYNMVIHYNNIMARNNAKIKGLTLIWNRTDVNEESYYIIY